MVDHKGAEYVVPAGSGYYPQTYYIEPDVSAACYFYAAAALTGGYALVKNVRSTSMQGDMKFLDVLKQLGCTVTEEQEGISVTGPANGEYDGVDVDMNDFSDQTMTLAALAPFAKTPTLIRNIEHIRLQESDRIEAIANELNGLCIDIKKGRDRIEIMPGQVKPGVVKTYSENTLGKFSKHDALVACPSLGSSSVESALKKLVDEGAIIRTGAGRKTMYMKKRE